MKDALGAVQSVLVLGGGSDIALATVGRLVAERTRTVVLASRNPDGLRSVVEQIRDAGATTVEAVDFDAEKFTSHERLLRTVFERHGDIDVVLVAFGVLGDQQRALRDTSAAVSILQTNFVGAASAMLAAARCLRAQGHGSLVVLSSVAAERPRRSNFIYGASKAGLDAFSHGLGDELAQDGVHVMVVRPGMVRTKMTAGMKSAPFTTTADAVAAEIVEGLRRRARTIWAPPLLHQVMVVLRHLPRRLFRLLDG